MKKNERKMQVLLSLEKFNQPATLNQLLEDLGEGYPARTVRRWLADYAKFGVVEKTGQKRATKYRLTASGVYKGAVLRHQTEDIEPFENYAADAIALFKKPLSKRLKSSYHVPLLAHYYPNKTSYLSQAQQQQMEKVGTRGRADDPEGCYAKEIANQLIPEMAFNCGRLDDTRISMTQVQTLFEQGTDDIDELKVQDVLLLNLFEATRFLIDNAETVEIDVTGISTLHYLLSDALVGDHHAGKVREKGIINNYTTYIPLEDHTKLQRLLGNICARAMHIESPFEQSIFLLVHIAYLQPFIAVNRRTARLCANIPLIRNNMVPHTFSEIKADDYDAATIAILERHDIQPMTELFYRSYMTICQKFDSSNQVVDFDEVRIKYRQQRRAIIKEVVTGMIIGEAILNRVIEFSRANIAADDQFTFEKSLMEEFKQLSPQRIAGTGLTRKQLNDWLALEEE